MTTKQSKMTTFWFNTGVKQFSTDPQLQNIPLMPGQVWKGGVKQIPFDCEDVPEGYKFIFASPYDNVPTNGDVIIREIHNSSLLGPYAYFQK